MNEFDRADVNAACWLRHKQQLWIDVIFTSNDQLLLITARQRARRQCRIRRTNVKALDDLAGTPLDRIVIEKNVTHVISNRRPIMHAEDRVLRETKIQQQSASMSIFRYV